MWGRLVAVTARIGRAGLLLSDGFLPGEQAGLALDFGAAGGGQEGGTYDAPGEFGGWGWARGGGGAGCAPRGRLGL